jgi:predicted nucleic-acid-binding protein
MLAIDTNIIVRLLTNDDAVQAEKARKLVAESEVFVTATVLLETEWVLRGAYGLAKADILTALRAFAGLPHVMLQDPVRAEKALTWAAAGMDFADALHLAGAEACEAFVTFDRQLVKLAGRVEDRVVREP